MLVFEDEQANAFALPGNKIGVYTGLLKYAKNQDQLAAVMGHEVAHVIAKHGNERVSSQMATEAGLGIAAAVLGSTQNENSAMILAGLGLGVQYGIILPFSRKHQSEADLIGLDLMARSRTQSGRKRHAVAEHGSGWTLSSRVPVHSPVRRNPDKAVKRTHPAD